MNYISIREDFLDTLIEDAMEHNHQEHNHLLKAGEFEQLDKIYQTLAKEFGEEIQNIIKIQLDTIATEMEAAVAYQNDKIMFLDKIEPIFNDILTENRKTLDEVVGQIYYQGKLEGFEAMEVERFFSRADLWSLQRIQNYDFNLIRNVSADVQKNVRESVFRSVARGEDMRQTAQRIKDTGIQPLTVGNRTWTVKQRAMTIARTETARARMQGNVLDMVQAQIELFNWNAYGPNACDDCNDYMDGNPYTLEDLPDYPAHPNCACDIGPAETPDPNPEEAKELLDLIGGDIVTLDDEMLEQAASDAGFGKNDLDDGELLNIENADDLWRGEG